VSTTAGAVNALASRPTAPALGTPYKGLVPYAEEDAAFFFGRDAEQELILANLMASRLTLVFGASGVGKSSLLSAGVGHRLREQGRHNLSRVGTPQTAVIVFNSWRDDPLVSLVQQVYASVSQAWERPSLSAAGAGLEGSVPSPRRPLVETLRACADLVDGELVMILDQFEEFFLYHPDDDGDRAGTFAAEFPRAVNSLELRASFLISIREDALAKLDRFEGRIPNLFDNYLRIEHLDRAAARAAIEQPVEQYNRIIAAAGDEPRVSIEPTLVDAVLDQVSIGRVLMGETGSGAFETLQLPRATSRREFVETPYLQLVMNRLWEADVALGEGRPPALRLATLERLGGAERIVRTHLDATMAALAPAQLDIAARVLRFLVTPSGTKIAHSVADLAVYAGLPEADLRPVLEALSEPTARVLMPVAPTLDGPSVVRYEIFHDVLAPAILDWRARWVRTQERSEANHQLAVERQHVWHLRSGLITVSVLLLAVLVLAVVGLQQSDAAARAGQIAFSTGAAANLENLFLGCFIFGALFTVMTALFGFHGAGLHGVHMGGHPAGHPGAGGSGANATHAGSQTLRMPLVTAPSLLGFLTWFGAAGYVLERFAALALVVVLVGALLAGAVGWYLITRFLMLILAGEREMHLEDYRLEGTLGRLTIGIPEGGTGEVVFSKAGARRSEAARALGGVSIPHGTEVVITSYVNGFATVQTWVEFTATSNSRQSGERC
jgi:hypothetical protein